MVQNSFFVHYCISNNNITIIIILLLLYKSKLDETW